VALGDRSEAEEAAQEAMTRALLRWRHVRSLDRPAAWLYVVAMNHVRDRWRHDHGPHRWDADADTSTADLSGGVTTTLSVREAIATCPPPARSSRAAVPRRSPHRRRRRRDGCAVGTVKATLHHALGSLRIELEEDDDAHR